MFFEKKRRYCRIGKQRKGLKTLVEKLSENFVIVELGVFAGEGTEIFAKKCEKVYAVDLWAESAAGMSKDVGSEETAKDIEDRFDQIVSKNPNIIKIKGRTDEVYTQFGDESLDFVYIDAQHEYFPVRKDIELWLPKIKLDGYIGGHDYDLKEWPGVVQAVTEIFGEKVYIFEDTSWFAKVSNEKISVLMPVYNRENLVKDAVNSVLNQTHENLELIIFDDMSTDNTLEVITKLAKKDSRIKIFQDFSSHGVTHARKKLIDLCKTRIACWIDSDDIINKYRIEIQFPYVRNGKTFVLSNAYWFKEIAEIYPNDYPKKIDKKWCCPAPCTPNFTCANSTPSAMFIMDKINNFDHHIWHEHLGEDCAWLAKKIKMYKPIVLDEILYYHREHPQRMVNVVPQLKDFTSGKNYHELLDKVQQEQYKSKRAIVTITNGDFYEFLSSYTHEDIKKYAERCNSEFIVLKDDKTDNIYDRWSKSCWAKFRIKDMLDVYDEILYIDTDFIVMDSAENLFSVVPKGYVGFFDETSFSSNWVYSQYPKYLKQLDLSEEKYFNKDKRIYYNAGIFLVRKDHKDLFDYPEDPRAFENTWEMCAEQSYLNINIKKFNIPVFDLGVHYNAFVRDEKDGFIFGIPIKSIKMFHLCGIFQLHKQDKKIAEDTIKNLKNKLEGKKTTIQNSLKEGEVVVRGPYACMRVMVNNHDYDFREYEAKVPKQIADELCKHSGYSIIT